MSDRTATPVAYKALLSVGMPEVAWLGWCDDGHYRQWEAHSSADASPYWFGVEDQEPRDLLTMHALRWLAGNWDLDVIEVVCVIRNIGDLNGFKRTPDADTLTALLYATKVVPPTPNL
jgi:hypothetical protein